MRPTLDQLEQKQASHTKAKRTRFALKRQFENYIMLIVIIAPMIGRYTSRTSIGIHNTYIMCCRHHALVGALPFQIPSQILPQTTTPYY